MVCTASPALQSAPLLRELCLGTGVLFTYECTCTDNCMLVESGSEAEAGSDVISMVRTKMMVACYLHRHYLDGNLRFI